MHAAKGRTWRRAACDGVNGGVTSTVQAPGLRSSADGQELEAQGGPRDGMIDTLYIRIRETIFSRNSARNEAATETWPPRPGTHYGQKTTFMPPSCYRFLCSVMSRW